MWACTVAGGLLFLLFCDVMYRVTGEVVNVEVCFLDQELN